jgi:hypothetical protein
VHIVFAGQPVLSTTGLPAGPDRSSASVPVVAP